MCLLNRSPMVIFTNEFLCVAFLFSSFRTILGRHTIEQLYYGSLHVKIVLKKSFEVKCLKVYSRSKKWIWFHVAGHIEWILLFVNCEFQCLMDCSLYPFFSNSSFWSIVVFLFTVSHFSDLFLMNDMGISLDVCSKK